MLSSSSTINRLARIVSLGRQRLRSYADLRGDSADRGALSERLAGAAGGQLDGNGGAAAGSAVDLQAAAMVFDDAVDDGHADAGAAVEERLEGGEKVGTLRLRHATAAVDHLDAAEVAVEAPDQPEGAAVGHGAHGVARQVPEDLADLVGVGEEPRRRRIEV